MRISDWSSDVCSSDLTAGAALCPPAHAADLNATANAAVVRPNTLIKTDDLDFGTLLSGPAGGSVTINPVTNGRSAAGGATLVGNDGRRAVFPGTRSEERRVGEEGVSTCVYGGARDP